MKKRVNIYPRRPITSVNPPIRGIVKGVTKDIQDIRRCIIAGARVEEILGVGNVIVLNLNNYDRDNGGEENPVDVRIDKAVPPIPAEEKREEPKDLDTSANPTKVTIPHEMAPAPKKPVVEEPALETMNFDDVMKDDNKDEVTMATSDITSEVKEEVAHVEEKKETTTPYKSLSKKERRELRKHQEQQKSTDEIPAESTTEEATE